MPTPVSSPRDFQDTDRPYSQRLCRERYDACYRTIDKHSKNSAVWLTAVKDCSYWEGYLTALEDMQGRQEDRDILSRMQRNNVRRPQDEQSF